MEKYEEKKTEERRYRITLLRFGKAIVMAESQARAAQKAIYLEETEIEWLSEKDGIPRGCLVSLIEPLDDTI